ncbi:MAG: peptidylprolyl isomerase [Gammaproteobacteria bacterium]|nr:MAG: peptidylprolyl isomerase [Gammaproteobacteria bacterium]
MSENNPRVVTIHYTLKNDAGEVLDSSEGQEPLSYLEGAQNIIPGLERALNGLASGDKTQVSIEPEDAYGERSEEMIQQVPLNAFEGVDKVEAGMRFQAQTPYGPRVVEVTAVTEEHATVDANHPLAGERLHFDVEVVEAREATAEEVEHGHVH